MNFPCVVRPRKRRKRAAEGGVKTATKDVSRGGLFFEAEAGWKVGTAIECLLELPLKAFGGRRVGVRCRGKIARVVTEATGKVGVGATIESFDFVHFGPNSAKESMKLGT